MHKKLGNNKNIGLALGGGAVLGAAHIGVLRALNEFNISISYIAGTSIGAFVAAFYAFGKSCEEIREMTKDLNWLDVSEISLSRYGLLSNKKLGEVITEGIGDVDFDQAAVPLAMIATDIATGEKVILREGRVSTAAMASTCLPGIFRPVEIDERLLVDGGIVENVPITPLQEMGADVIIAVDLLAKRTYKKPENIIEVLVNTFNYTLIAATKVQTEAADILIQPDVSSFNMINTNQVNDLIEAGYAEAKTMLENNRD